MSVTEIQSEEHFLKFANNSEKKLVFVDFYADWCGPCKHIAPYIHSLAKKERNIYFVKVNVDKVDEVANYFKVKAMPTFVVLREGKEIARGSGASSILVDDLLKKAKMVYNIQYGY